MLSQFAVVIVVLTGIISEGKASEAGQPPSKKKSKRDINTSSGAFLYESISIKFLVFLATSTFLVWVTLSVAGVICSCLLSSLDSIIKISTVHRQTSINHCLHCSITTLIVLFPYSLSVCLLNPTASSDCFTQWETKQSCQDSKLIHTVHLHSGRHVFHSDHHCPALRSCSYPDIHILQPTYHK